jgi:hypothetical protein
LVAVRGAPFRFGEPPTADRLAHIGRSLRCQYCGDPLEDEGAVWGFDDHATPECQVCYDFRDGRDPEKFRALCRKVASHGRS